MEELLNLDLFQIKTEYKLVIMFVWNLTKCLILFLASVQILRFLSEKFFTRILPKIESQERQQQIITLKAIIVHAIELVIFIIFVLNVLNIFGIDVRPLLATAGVMGVAIGFGAKRFVEDVITGIMILIEGQIRVGDYVEIQDMKGFVEKITLPLITVRSDTSGALYFIRCGYIDSIKNHTINHSYAFFEYDVAYKENVDHVFKTLHEAFQILKKDPEANEKIISDLEIWGLDGFKESSICIKSRIKTQPKGQWMIKRRYNKIVKELFERENIEIPFNQLVVTNNN